MNEAYLSLWQEATSQVHLLEARLADATRALEINADHLKDLTNENEVLRKQNEQYLRLIMSLETRLYAHGG